MPQAVKSFVRWVDAINHRIGRMTMYLIFVMMGVLLWSSISKTFFTPTLWTLETAQFLMVGYYIVGGPYAMQLGSNVRMDLFYGNWSHKTKACVDAITVFFLLYFLGVLLYGALGSTAYSLGYWGDQPLAFFGGLIKALVTGGFDAAGEVIGRMEQSPTAWRPLLWPIKAVMCFGLVMMILQAFAEFLRDIGRIRGEEF